jgi:hypothetical protein
MKNLFGGKKKEQPKKEEPVVNKSEESKIAMEKQMHMTNLQV